MKKYEFIGVTDEFTTCDLCGKTRLKKTMILKDMETLEFVFAGVDCGVEALGWYYEQSKKNLKKAEWARQDWIESSIGEDVEYKEFMKNPPCSKYDVRGYNTARNALIKKLQAKYARLYAEQFKKEG